MKSNWNTELERLVQNVPNAAEVMIEAAKVDAEDIKATKDQWDAATSHTNLTLLDDGGVIITGSLVDKIEHTTQDSNLTDLNSSSPYTVARVTWANGSDPEDMDITHILAWLDPSGSADVEHWACRLAVLQEVHGTGTPADPYRLELEWITLPVYVDATAGGGAAEVDFDFSAVVPRPRPKRTRPINGGSNYPSPVMFVFIFALDGDGNDATSVGWGRNSAQTTDITTSSNVLSTVTLTESTDPKDKGLYTSASDMASGQLYITVQTGSYSAQTISFTTVAPDNRLDLGAAPSGDVEFMGEGQTFSGTELDYFVRNDADSAWVEYNDGDTDSDLAGVGKNQYYKIQCTLNPDAGGQVSPILRAMGAREITIEDLSKVAEVKRLSYALDPITGKAEVGEAVIAGIKDGAPDFSDAITELLSDYDIGAIQFCVWIGHSDSTVLSRANWMKVDDFLIDDFYSDAGAIRVVCLSPLCLVKATLPVYDTAANTRDPLRYANSTLKDTYDDIIDAQLALAGRWRGPGIEDDTTTISKEITDSDVKDEADAVCFLDGSAMIGSQGRIKVVDLFGDKAVVAVFPSKEITATAVSPGFADRIPEYFVPWDWTPDERYYKEEDRYYHGDGLTKLGRARVQAPRRLDNVVAEWIDVEALADTVGDRMIQAFGTGRVGFAFQCAHAHPQLELGDLVAVQTDKFVARDPNTSRAVKGNLWVAGVVVGIGDVWGRQFNVWVRGYEDIFATTARGDVSGFLKRFRAKVYKSADQTYGAGSAAVVSFNSEAFDYGTRTEDLHDNATNNERLTIPTGGDGTYKVQASLPYHSGVIGWYLSLRKNGTDIVWQNHEVGLATGVLVISEMLDLVGGDYLDLYIDCNHTLGSGSLIVDGGAQDDAFFSAVRLGV